MNIRVGWEKGWRYTAQHIEIRTAPNDWIVTQTEAQLYTTGRWWEEWAWYKHSVSENGAGFQLSLSLTVLLHTSAVGDWLVVREVTGSSSRIGDLY